jgi:hypothetical protein
LISLLCHISLIAASVLRLSCPVPISLQSLRHDVLNSLYARLQLLCEDSEESTGGFALPSGGMPFFSWHFPRRLFAPLEQGAAVCDYLLAYEQEKDGVSRMEELLGLKDLAQQGQPFIAETCDDAEPPADTAAAVEQFGASTSSSSSSSASTASSDSKTAVATTDHTLLLIGVAVVAIAVTVAFLQFM